MKRKTLKTLTILTLLIGLFFAKNSFSQNKVVIGYIPTWTNMQSVIDNTDLSIITHVNISFVNPNASGVVMASGEPVCCDASAASINYVVNKAHQNGVKVLASLGGGSIPSCSGNWSTLLQVGNRSNVVNNLVAFANYFNLDGIDVDIEGTLLNSIDLAGNYTPFIQELRSRLNPLGKLVTCATASYNGGMVPVSSIPYFDYINLMSYDNNWGASGNHSTYADAVAHMQLWLSRGCPAYKLVLGVPFYGYTSSVGTGGTAYSTIVNQYPDAAYSDSYAGYNYNGIPTIEAKTRYAVENGAGVMIWQVAQDVNGSLSLLQAIGRNIGNNGNNVANIYQHCDYTGYSIGLQTGDYNLSTLIAKGMIDDDVSSIKVNSGYELVAFWEDNFGGSSITITGDNACLVDEGWNDEITSIRVREASNNGWSTVIEAEDFVNMSGVQNEACSEGGQNVGWIDAGDWMVWDVTLPSSGNYNVEYRVASLNGGGTIQFEKAGGSPVYGSIGVPSTSGWQNWTTISHNVSLDGGTQQIAIAAPAGGYNINWIKLTQTSQKSGKLASTIVEESSLKVYPNPVNDVLTVDLNDKIYQKIQMVDYTGKVIMTKQIESNTANFKLLVNHLNSGVYILMLSNQSEVKTVKVIKD